MRKDNEECCLALISGQGTWDCERKTSTYVLQLDMQLAEDGQTFVSLLHLLRAFQIIMQNKHDPVKMFVRQPLLTGGGLYEADYGEVAVMSVEPQTTQNRFTQSTITIAR